MGQIKRKKVRVLTLILIIAIITVVVKVGFFRKNDKHSASSNAKEMLNYESETLPEYEEAIDSISEEAISFNENSNNITESTVKVNSSTGITTITFVDSNMYNKICEELQDKITQSDDTTNAISLSSSDLVTITKLELNNSNITNIDGIENFTALTELNISNNNITNISDLSVLTNLTKLYAYGNTISDLSAISNLSKLKYLNIAKNKLEDSTEESENNITKKISSLTNLIELDMSHNLLRYTNGLNTLTKLTKLDLYDNAIHDLKGLSTLTNLTELNLGENNETTTKCDITGLESLNNLVKLKYLDFSENRTDTIIDNITNLVNLETISLQENEITDISKLGNLTKLKKVNLYGNSIKTFSTELFKLVDLEELILGNNDLRNITELCNKTNNTYSIVWNNLKKLDLSSNKYIYTLYATEQSSGSTTRIDNNAKIIELLKEKVKELNYEYITNTDNLPHYDSNGVAYVTYDDFEAKCDGVFDDFIAIRNAHIYANEHGCEVRATVGKTYHIFKYYEDAVRIKTNVDWKDATFIIHDEEIEKVSGRFQNLFRVTNMNIEDRIIIDNPNWTIGKNTTQISELSATLEELNKKGYKTYLCAAVNSDKKQYIRYGSNANSGDNQQDYFIIDNEANVLNDIQWDFDKITRFTIYPIPNTNISVKNGNFISNALNSQSETPSRKSSSEKGIYFARNIFIYQAANIKVSGINHKLSYELDEDEMSGSYRGFIYTNTAANVEISDSSLFTRKNSISGRSTYGLNINANVNIICKNITSNNINDTYRWGIVASYFSKDVTFENCTLNRIDAHQGIYNLTVKNCNIGTKGLTLTGQGELNVIGTTIEANTFIPLRNDYGSTWDGDVNIEDCVYKYDGTSAPKLVSASLSYDNYDLHDFGYDCKMPNIKVYNLTIDMQNNTNYDYFYIMGVNGIKKEEEYLENTTNYLQKYLPNSIYINGYKIINSPKISTLKIGTTNLIPYLNDYNYVISNTSLKENGSDENLFREMDSTNDYFSNKILDFKIDKNNSAQNTVSIYKDNQAIIENQSIDNIYTYQFVEDGKYRIDISSSENIEKYAGIKTYEFSIDKEEPSITGVENGKEYQTVTPIITDKNIEKIILTKDGVIQEGYESGNKISEEGNYELTAIDKAGNEKTVNFTIKKPIDDTITSSDYEVNEEDFRNIDRISPNTNLSTFKNKIFTEIGYKVIDKSGKEISNTDLIGTGYKLITDSGKEYTLIVIGDLNSDGKINISDLSMLRKHYLKVELLQGEYEKAADLENNGSISLNDMAIMRKVILKVQEI